MEIERAAVDAWNRHDLDAILSGFSEDVEWDDRRRFGGGSHRGREALRAQFASMLEAAPDLSVETDILAAQGDFVVTRGRWSTGQAEVGGGEAEVVMASVLTFRDKRIVRLEVFDTDEDALEAVELREKT